MAEVIARHPVYSCDSVDSRVLIGAVSTSPSFFTRSVCSSASVERRIDSRSRSRGRSRSRSRGRSRSRSRGRSRSRSRNNYRSRSPLRTRRRRRVHSRSLSRSPSSHYSYRDRSRSSNDTHVDNSGTLAVNILSKEKVRSLRSWMVDGMSPAEAKALRDMFNPTFEGSFALQCPILDESMGRTLKRLKGSSGTVVDFVEKTWLSTHYKVMDVARPLIQLWGLLPPHDPQLQFVESALRLWGVAFREITKNRRKNILRQTAPDFLNLLSDPNMFSKREMSRLFGVHFLNAMAKEAEEENKIAKVGRHSSSQRARGKNPRGFTQPSTSGATSVGNSSRGSNNNHRSSRSVCFNHPSYSSIPVGGRLARFAHEWRSISSDSFILEMVSVGVTIDFLEPPFQVSVPSSCAMSAEMTKACDAEVSELVRKRAIFPISYTEGGFYSSLFLVPKKSGGYRPIVNLKKLNTFVRYEHFKMETMEDVRQLLRPGDFLAKLDLKDAYLTVPMRTEHQPFLRFSWRDRFFQFVCLPFGLSSAPRLFTKLLKPVVSQLRRLGIRLVIYLDDMLFMNESEEKLIKDLRIAINLLSSLGFLINWDKSILSPAKSIEFLGLLVNSTDLSLALPLKAVSSILSICNGMLSQSSVSLRNLSSLLGHFSWAIPTVPFAQTHYRNLQRLYISNLHPSGDLSRSVYLSFEAREDIRWWVANLSISNGHSFFKKDPDLSIYSDASLQGWGFSCDGICSRGPWAGSDRLRHINELELLAAFYALKALTAHSFDLTVNLILDNSTAVSYVNKRGGTRSKSLCDISTSIFRWCESRNLSLTATHLPGNLNSVADSQSRSSLDASDWMLNKSTFQELIAIWPMDIDLFAAKWNAQLPRFVSWLMQPDAFALNAFSLKWSKLLGYAFPPFTLIARCLAKIRREKAELVMVCPVWPSQPWFPLLLQMASDVPRILRPHPDLLRSSAETPHPLLAQNSLILSAWRLSGDASLGTAFRKRWSTFSWRVIETPRQMLISRHGHVGVIGAVDGVKIPCLVL